MSAGHQLQEDGQRIVRGTPEVTERLRIVNVVQGVGIGEVSANWLFSPALLRGWASGAGLLRVRVCPASCWNSRLSVRNSPFEGEACPLGPLTPSKEMGWGGTVFSVTSLEACFLGWGRVSVLFCIGKPSGLEHNQLRQKPPRSFHWAWGVGPMSRPLGPL